MKQLSIRHAVLFAMLVVAASCEQGKSANPLSPLIAGPIEGVSVSAPILLEPTTNQAIDVAQQPLTLMIENGSSNGVRPVLYLVDVSTDANFTTMVFQKSGIPAGPNGRTTVKLPDPLAPERTYYWRSKADDGANASAYTAAKSFSIFTPVVIGAPTLKAPTDGGKLTTRRPTLTINNAIRTGPAGAITYLFEAAESPTMAVRLAAVEIAEGSGGETSFAVTSDLPYATRYFWRVRAFDPKHEGPWSAVFSFVTPDAPPPPPVVTPPPSTPGPTPGPAPGDELNLNDVTWAKGEHIKNWAVTSTITRAYRNGSDFCTEHTKSGQWPVLGFFDIPGVVVEGSQIMIANIGGKWYGGAGEWLRPGQVCKLIDGHVGQNVYYDSPPLQYWTPSPGELVGVAVSTPSRAGQWGTAERSNVVLIRW
jgi:hypothetical protein